MGNQLAFEQANGTAAGAQVERRRAHPETDFSSDLRVAGIRLHLDPGHVPRRARESEREWLAGRDEATPNAMVAPNDDQAQLARRGGLESGAKLEMLADYPIAS